MSDQDVRAIFICRTNTLLALPGQRASAKPDDQTDGQHGPARVARGVVLARRKIMRRPMAFIGLLAVLLCLWTVGAHAVTLNVTDGLDHGVGHFRPLRITRQRHLLAYHGIAMSCEGLCQVFRQFFITTTHCILITYKCAFISMACKKSKKIK